MKPLVTTPRTISPRISKFCQTFNGSPKVPNFILVQPTDNARYDSCFEIVGELVNKHGGEVVYGWTIWEWKHLYVSAEFHAVWRRPEGGLIDPNPKADGERRILFLADPLRRFNGTRMQNRFMPYSDEPVVRDWIRHAQKLDELSPPPGKVSLVGTALRYESLRWQLLIPRMLQLSKRLNNAKRSNRSR